MSSPALTVPSYASGTSEIPLLGETIGAVLSRVARTTPDAEALVDVPTARRWTYAELDAAVTRLAAGLIARGVAPGDRVALWAPNIAEWVITQYAAARAGAILVVVNPAYRTGELKYVLKHSGSRLLISVPTFKTSDYRAMLTELIAERTGYPPDMLADDIDLEADLSIGSFKRTEILGLLAERLPDAGLDEDARAELSRMRTMREMAEAMAGETAPVLSELAPECPELREIVFIGDPEWADLATGAEPGPEVMERQNSLGFDDPINIQYTSGTTGLPKGATLTHHNILNNGFFTGAVCRYSAADRICVPVPFYHCFGMVMGNLAALAHGATLVIPAPSFDPAATLRAVAQERCTSLYGVPTMFIAMLGDPSIGHLDLSSLRTGIMAGSPCPIEVMKRVVNDMGIGEMTIAYGMTETSPVSCHTNVEDDLERRVSTIGRVHPHLEIAIVDPETNRIVPRGEPGEFRTRGYSVMRGYWNDPDKTAEVIDEAGWMRTGDLAAMDADGYVKIVGRIKDTVIRGGENVAPREVEEFLYAHPDIVDVQVVGVPDETLGEELCACVRVAAGASVDAAAIREFCAGRISHHKIPRYVVTVDAFPMTVNGKIQKNVLRERMVRELGLNPL
jgi:fatty-acyl-CoA synthase